MKNHGIKQSKLDSVVKSFGCRYTNGRLHSLPLQRRSFVGQGSSLEALPPCWKTVRAVGTLASVEGVKHAVFVVERRGKPLEPGCDTHNKP